MPFTYPLIRPRLFQARIQPQPDGRFAFARDGEEACLVNVPDDLGWYGDCVGWLDADPAEWWMQSRRLPILGMPEIAFANDAACDLFLLATPARFFALGTTGPWPGPCAVILDWDARDSLRLWLSLVRGVRCETPALTRAMRGLLDAEPARQRLRIGLADTTKPMPETAPERVYIDFGTILEPFPLPDREVRRLDPRREEVEA